MILLFSRNVDLKAVQLDFKSNKLWWWTLDHRICKTLRLLEWRTRRTPWIFEEEHFDDLKKIPTPWELLCLKLVYCLNDASMNLPWVKPLFIGGSLSSFKKLPKSYQEHFRQLGNFFSKKSLWRALTLGWPNYFE